MLKKGSSFSQLCCQLVVNYVINKAVINVREKKAVKALSNINIKDIRFLYYKESSRYLKFLQNNNYIKPQTIYKIYSHQI